MPLQTTNYLCPSCNGALRYDGEKGLVCDYCGSTFTPAEVEQIYAERQAAEDAKAAEARGDEAAVPQQAAQAQQPAVGPDGQPVAAQAQATPQQTAAQASAAEVAGMHNTAPAASEDPIQAYLERSQWTDAEEEGMCSYQCPSCGASLITDEATAVTSCPYCGNPTVLPGTLSGALKPDLVIPFKVNKDKAIQIVKDFYSGKRYLPSAFVSQNHLQEIQGVYVPFWLFTARADGSAQFQANIVRTRRDAANQYITTETYRLDRSGNMTFERVPVDASTRMPDAHMDAIEPFDYSELKEFSVGYLPGYVTERYDQDAKTCEERAHKRIKQSMTNVLANSATGEGFSDISCVGASATCTTTEVKYALLPVWMLHTTWNDTDFLFAVNGQTGKAIGDLPVDEGKVNRDALICFLALAAIFTMLAMMLVGY